MKKFKMLLLFVTVMGVLLIISACADNNDSSSEPPAVSAEAENNGDDSAGETSGAGTEGNSGIGTASNVSIPAGFVEYRSSQYGFSIYHPSGWIALDQNISMDEIVELLGDEFGDGLDAMINAMDGADLDNVAVVWYDFDNMVSDVAPNTNVVVTSSGGLTQDDLKSPESKAELQSIFETMFRQVFENFSVASDLTGRYLGDNYYVLFRFDAAPMGISMSFYQVMTVIGDRMYTFTHTTESGRLGITSNAFEQMLSTLTVN